MHRPRLSRSTGIRPVIRFATSSNACETISALALLYMGLKTRRNQPKTCPFASWLTMLWDTKCRQNMQRGKEKSSRLLRLCCILAMISVGMHHERSASVAVFQSVSSAGLSITVSALSSSLGSPASKSTSSMAISRRLHCVCDIFATRRDGPSQTSKSNMSKKYWRFWERSQATRSLKNYSTNTKNTKRRIGKWQADSKATKIITVQKAKSSGKSSAWNSEKKKA